MALTTENTIRLQPTPIIVVDLETTDLNMKKHEIIEIGCYNITAGQQWSTFVHPDRTKASDTTHIHGITDEDAILPH